MKKKRVIRVVGPFLACLVGAALSVRVCAAAVNPLKNTYCNPIDIPYNFWEVRNGQAYREGADPDMVLYKGEFFLFSSHAGGYWWSSDMRDWHLVIPTGLDLVKYAPGVMAIGDTMYYTSSEGGRMYRTTDPKGGVWTNIWNGINESQVASTGDPNLFLDDDGRVYCYNGLGPNGSIGVIEFNPNKNMTTIGSRTTLIHSDTLNMGSRTGAMRTWTSTTRIGPGLKRDICGNTTINIT
jgi:xylan 1,4-beta-xylosidase